MRLTAQATLLIFFLATGIFACVKFKHQRDLEKRATSTAHTLHQIYVRTSKRSLRIVYANASAGNVCMEYLVDDSREQSFTRFTVFEKDSKTANYDLDEDDMEDRCSMAGVDLTKIAEARAR